MSLHKEQKTVCDVNCEEIIDDYAHLMAEIEDMIKGYSKEVKCESMSRETFATSEENERPIAFWKRIKWKSVFKYGGAAVAGAIGATLGLKGIEHFTKGVV